MIRVRAWLGRHGDVIFLLVFMLVLNGAVLVRATTLDTSTRHALCPVIRLITRKPVPRPPDPAANPSREQAWEFYEDFVAAKRQYGCG